MTVIWGQTSVIKFFLETWFLTIFKLAMTQEVLLMLQILLEGKTFWFLSSKTKFKG
jgi:hypothetical protein